MVVAAGAAAGDCDSAIVCGVGVAEEEKKKKEEETKGRE